MSESTKKGSTAQRLDALEAQTAKLMSALAVASKPAIRIARVEINTPSLECSFCGLPQRHVEHMLRDRTVNICDQCVDLAAEVLAEERARRASESATKEGA